MHGEAASTHPICLMASLVESVEAFDKELAGAGNEIAELQFACVLIEKLPPYVGSADIQLPEKADWGLGLAALREAMSGATIRLSNKVNRKGLAWIKTLCDNGTAELEGGVSGQVANKIPNATAYMKNSAATFDLCSGQQLEKAVLGSSWAEFADALPQYVKVVSADKSILESISQEKKEFCDDFITQMDQRMKEMMDCFNETGDSLDRLLSRYRCLGSSFFVVNFSFLEG